MMIDVPENMASIGNNIVHKFPSKSFLAWSKKINPSFDQIEPIGMMIDVPNKYGIEWATVLCTKFPFPVWSQKEPPSPLPSKSNPLKNEGKKTEF
jgi:hypothetical protein